MDRDLSVFVSILSSIGGLCDARALAIWESVDDQIQLLVEWQMDPATCALLRRDWSEVERELQAGRRVSSGPDVLLIPILAPGGRLLGVLHYVGPPPLAGEQHLLDETARNASELLAGRVPDPACTPRMRPLLAVDLDGEPDTFTRRAYGALLERCGGDVSAAAAMLSMARSLLYERMDACGLTRWTGRKRTSESEG